MTQALMPGDEPIEIKFKPKEPERPASPSWETDEAGGALHGCNCSACRQRRQEAVLEQARRAQMVSQYGVWPVGARSEPTPVPPFNGSIVGFIRGRYDFDQSTMPDSGLQGQVRWRRPGTLEVYDERGLRQWTYEDELPDGTLTNRAGSMWRPEPEPITVRPPIFNWDDVSPVFDPSPIFRGAS